MTKPGSPGHGTLQAAPPTPAPSRPVARAKEASAAPPAYVAQRHPTDRKGQRVLGTFRIVRELGTGSFATAFLACQEGTERKAVVKVAHPHLMRSKHGSIIASRFAAEFKAATRVQHPHLVTVFTAGQTPDNLPAIAMEYIPGRLLKQVLMKHSPLSPTRSLRLIQPLIAVLDALHKAKVIHRDISPNNIMVTRPAAQQRARLKLLDLGIAKLDNNDEQTMGPLGTPRYLAPEQFFGRATFASDIYSVGAILWWMLTGEEHLQRVLVKGSSLATIMSAPVSLMPQEIVSTLPPVLIKLLQDMLAYKPEDRPTARQLRVRIGHMRKSLRSTGAGPVSRVVRPLLTGSFPVLPRVTRSSLSLPEYNTSPPPAEGISYASYTPEGSHITDQEAKPSHASAPDSLPEGSVPEYAAPAASLPPIDVVSSEDGLARTLSSWTASERKRAVTRFVGGMPELLAQMDLMAEQHNMDGLEQLAEHLAQSAKQMGAAHMARLATMVVHMCREGMGEEALQMTRQIHEEYTQTFHQLISVLMAS